MPTTAAPTSWAEIALHLPQYAYMVGGGGAPGGGTPVTATGTTPAGTLAGAAPGGGAGAYGAVPNVPSPATTQAQALQTNLANLAPLQDLATRTNVFGQEQLLNQYRAAIPQYNALTQKSAANIAANLRGEINPDVLRNMQQAAAERGVASGTAGSPNVGAQYLRLLGLTSTGQQALGEQQLTGAMGRAPISAPLNLAQYYVTPEQQFQAQSMANLYAASPDPAAAAAAQEAAVNRGLNRGLAVGGTGAGRAPTVPQMGQGGGYDIANGILGRYGGGAQGTVIGGVEYGPGQSPVTAATNWQQWAAGLGSQAASPEDTYANDLYTYFGVTPEDLSSMGMTLQDLYPGGQLAPENFGYEGAG